jgi:hypothetical protein
MKIGNKEFKVTVPDDPRKGLLGTNSIAKDRLMKFSFPDGKAHITMKGMGYPIDLIAVDKGKVSQVIKAKVGEDYMFKSKEVYEAKNDSGIEVGQVVKAQKGIGPLLSHKNTKPLSNLVTDLEAMRLLNNYDSNKDLILPESTVVARPMTKVEERSPRTYIGGLGKSANKAAKFSADFYNKSVMPSMKFETDTLLPLIREEELTGNKSLSSIMARRYHESPASNQNKQNVRRAVKHERLTKGLMLPKTSSSDVKGQLYQDMRKRVDDAQILNSGREYHKTPNIPPPVKADSYDLDEGYHSDEYSVGGYYMPYAKEPEIGIYPTIEFIRNLLKGGGKETLTHEVAHSEYDNFKYKDLSDLIKTGSKAEDGYTNSDTENMSRLHEGLKYLESQGKYRQGHHINESLLKDLYLATKQKSGNRDHFIEAFPTMEHFKTYFNTKFGPRSTSDYKQGGLLKAQNGSVLAKLHFKAKTGKEPSGAKDMVIVADMEKNPSKYGIKEGVLPSIEIKADSEVPEKSMPMKYISGEARKHELDQNESLLGKGLRFIDPSTRSKDKGFAAFQMANPNAKPTDYKGGGIEQSELISDVGSLGLGMAGKLAKKGMGTVSRHLLQGSKEVKPSVIDFQDIFEKESRPGKMLEFKGKLGDRIETLDNNSLNKVESTSKDFIKHLMTAPEFEKRFKEFEGNTYLGMFPTPYTSVLRNLKSRINDIPFYSHNSNTSYGEWRAPNNFFNLAYMSGKSYDQLAPGEIFIDRNNPILNKISVGVHELTHGLTSGNLGLSNKSKNLLSEVGLTKKQYEDLDENLGLDPKSIMKHQEYMNSPTEIHARINQLRHGLYPNSPYKALTHSEVEDWVNSNYPSWGSYYDLKKLTDVANKMYSPVALGLGIKSLTQPKQETKSFSKGGLLVLDDKANVQHEISDGSRIFSRVHTKQLLSLRDKIASMKAGGPIKESHKELAELFFKLIAHQDKLEPEYV